MILSLDNGHQPHLQHIIITAWRSNIFLIGRYHTKSIYYKIISMFFLWLLGWWSCIDWTKAKASKLIPEQICIQCMYIKHMVYISLEISTNYLEEGCKKMWQREKLAEPYSQFRTTPRYHLYFKTVIRPK